MSGYKSLFYILLLFLISISTANAAEIHEAEDATVAGAAVSSSDAGFTGTGFVDFQNSSGDYIEWTINASQSGPVGDYQSQLSTTDGLLNSSDQVTVTVADSVCPVGDIDGDCIVSLADLSLLASSWLDETAAGDVDLNGDRRVNLDDFLLISQSFGDDWTGSLEVTISPQEAAAAGAMWRLDGGRWQLSGTTLSGIPNGSHDIEFSLVSGWVTPKIKTVQVTQQQTTFALGEYLDISKAIVINEFMAGNSYVPFTNPLNIKTRVYGWDVYPDWIELHNKSDQAIDVGGMYLTDDDDLLTKWRFPDNTMIQPNGYLIIFASGKTAEEYAGNYPYVDDWGSLHTNFELSSDGEYLALVQADGQTVIHSYAPEYPEQIGLVSYGLTSTATAGYLKSPTPGTLVNNKWTGAANTGAYNGIVADTKFSVKRGFYNTPFEVVISCDTPGALIYYTTDSSEPVDIYGNPTSTAQLYSASNKPQITTTTCLRAAAVKTGWLPSNIDTQTYIFAADVLDQAAPGDYAASWGGYPADYKLEDDSTDIKLVAGNAVYTVPQARTVIKDSLLTIPTLSVVSHPDNLFSSYSTGIYLNTTRAGINWERFCSAELFDPLEGSKFQLNCGLRIQGGASRNPGSSPKHSLSLRFRSGYGPGKLNHKLFPGSPVDSFNALQLRAMYNNSWIHWSYGQRLRGSMIRDQWVRDSLIDMGNSSAGCGTYVHLYLNGLYWGVYNLHERQEASHYGEHFDVDPDTLDAITSNIAADGNMNSWNALQTLAANASFDGNIDLTEYNTIRSKLDVVNLCDYMIANHFGANHDWHNNNWRAAGGGVNSAPWKIYSWDAERILEGITASELNSEGSNSPRLLFSRLRYSEEFNMLFADRVHKHYFNNGSLTAANAARRWMNRANTLDQAIIAESARWGDYRRDVHVKGTAYLFTRNDHWIVEQDRLIYSYFNVSGGLNRSEQVLQNQYIPNGYYPSVDAPVFYINGVYQHGGYVDTNDILTMTNPGGSGTIYYTMDGSDPRLPGGAINPLAEKFEIGSSTTQEVLTESTTVKARVLNGGTWSALNEAVYAVGPVADSLRISEIMYNPPDPDTEYIELTNIGSEVINLTGVSFTRGISFTFPSLSLAPGEFVLVVRNLAEFEAFYDTTGWKIAGQYTGKLSNDGEKIELKDILSAQIHLFDYSDNWYDLTDGMGFSLTIRDPAQNLILWDQKSGWRTSLYKEGTPGDADSVLDPGSIVINELLAHSHASNPDWIELYNTTAQDINIAGWFLSDNNNDDPNLMKYQIPEGTIIGAYGYAVFTQDVGQPGSDYFPFGLSEAGETVYLTSGEDGKITGYYQTEENFDASETGVTFGRYEKAELTGGYDFTPMISPTMKNPNSGPLISDIVITEIHYNPPQGSSYEFVELYNRSSSAVTLMSAADRYTSPTTFVTENIPWRLEGTGYQFPANTTIPAGGRVIVAKDPTKYGELSSTVLGPYDGKLDNGGEQIALQLPGDWEYGELSRYWIPIEKIDYDDDSPWPITPDGGGDSLHRINPAAYGRDYSNWHAKAPDPGSD